MTSVDGDQVELDQTIFYPEGGGQPGDTGMHVLGSMIPVPVTGGSVGPEKSRLDFDLGEHQIDQEDR